VVIDVLKEHLDILESCTQSSRDIRSIVGMRMEFVRTGLTNCWNGTKARNVIDDHLRSAEFIRGLNPDGLVFGDGFMEDDSPVFKMRIETTEDGIL
jgi:hypothetical protein